MEAIVFQRGLDVTVQAQIKERENIFFIALTQQKTHFCLVTKVRFLNDVCLSRK